MPKFEIVPPEPRAKLEFQIEAQIQNLGYEVIVLERSADQLRLSVITVAEVGTGSHEHKQCLKVLRENIDFITEQNSALLIHPTGAVNITIDLTEIDNQ